MRSQSSYLRFSVAMGALALAFVGCNDSAPISSGLCAVDETLQCQPGFVGYSCQGSVRPDQSPTGSESVQGIVCTDEGMLETNRNEDFCCTAGQTTCAYNPGAGCAAPNVGYACMGADRPEAFDSTIFCGTGLRQNGLNVFCCGPMSTQICATSTAVVCPTGTVGWSCTGPDVPSEANLGVDQSRADSALVCDVAASPAAGASQYCCFTPSAIPLGGTCLSDHSVTGCAAGTFPFACTGPDSPDQDYPRVACSRPPVHGVNAQGIAAENFCCDYQQTL